MNKNNIIMSYDSVYEIIESEMNNCIKYLKEFKNTHVISVKIYNSSLPVANVRLNGVPVSMELETAIQAFIAYVRLESDSRDRIHLDILPSPRLVVDLYSRDARIVIDNIDIGVLSQYYSRLQIRHHQAPSLPINIFGSVVNISIIPIDGLNEMYTYHDNKDGKFDKSKGKLTLKMLKDRFADKRSEETSAPKSDITNYIQAIKDDDIETIENIETSILEDIPKVINIAESGVHTIINNVTNFDGYQQLMKKADGAVEELQAKQENKRLADEEKRKQSIASSMEYISNITTTMTNEEAFSMTDDEEEIDLGASYDVIPVNEILPSNNFRPEEFSSNMSTGVASNIDPVNLTSDKPTDPIDDLFPDLEPIPVDIKDPNEKLTKENNDDTATSEQTNNDASVDDDNISTVQ